MKRNSPSTSGTARCRRKFLRFFPKGFRDETYLTWERDYKWKAHQQWEEVLNREAFAALLRKKVYAEIAAHAVRIESRTNLLFSFEKMALRDAVKSPTGARTFATGLHAYLHEAGKAEEKFEQWCARSSAVTRGRRVIVFLTLAYGMAWTLGFGFFALGGRRSHLRVAR